MKTERRQFSDPRTFSDPEGALKALYRRIQETTDPEEAERLKEELSRFNTHLQDNFGHLPSLSARWTVEQAQRHHGLEIPSEELEPFI